MILRDAAALSAFDVRQKGLPQTIAQPLHSFYLFYDELPVRIIAGWVHVRLAVARASDRM